MRALVVDDSLVIVRMVSALLREMGIEVTEASEGEEGYVAFQQHPFELVVTDIMMPVCDGIELTRKIRTIDPKVPILILTSAADIHHVIQARDAGANAYLLKPLEPALLRQRVDELLAETMCQSAG
jgi:two-component system chemotaxis sensor kinase CheA/two-component system sensor histidine kinase and response regulator WspE